jgi:hypothetical protein
MRELYCTSEGCTLIPKSKKKSNLKIKKIVPTKVVRLAVQKQMTRHLIPFKPSVIQSSTAKTKYQKQKNQKSRVTQQVKIVKKPKTVVVARKQNVQQKSSAAGKGRVNPKLKGSVRQPARLKTHNVKRSANSNLSSKNSKSKKQLLK